MIPRRKFANPPPVESVARSELFDVQVGSTLDEEKSELQNKLHELIQSTLEGDVSGRATKRQKLNPHADVSEEASTAADADTSVLFRLFSTPRTISLLPRPPPPPVTREPECEDSPAAAETRRRRAQAVAVDAAWVIQQAVRLPPPFRAGHVLRVQADPAVSGAAPPMLRAHCLQGPRKTRPPVPRSQLQHYPYVPTPILSSEHAKGVIPSVEVEMVRELPRKTRKRRRGKSREMARPQATFWWPPAGCGGKSLGYGMGYY
ncbi:hypothetical protein DFH07DRAFT_339771 [Mycena maculata]|uniref:Uncharacterized protein n=1 Tax=Mycena maculata TaxID=230809 RepID=A0AAD7MHK8_9AGAR|nr:hypothetical protein DFH07DRAFT_339771 [Mycena maculata]